MSKQDHIMQTLIDGLKDTKDTQQATFNFLMANCQLVATLIDSVDRLNHTLKHGVKIDK